MASQPQDRKAASDGGANSNQARKDPRARMIEDHNKQVRDLDYLIQKDSDQKEIIRMLSEDKTVFEEGLRERDETSRILSNEKQVSLESLRARDATIARLRAIIQNAAEITQQTARHMGIPEPEEIKEEISDQLVRQLNLISEVAQEDPLTLDQPIIPVIPEV